MGKLDRKPPTILAIDPGGTTGYCGYVPGQDLVRGELPNATDGHFMQLWQLLRSYETKAYAEATEFVIVCERFEFRRDERDRDNIDYMAAEYVGAIKLFQRMHAYPRLVLQSASAVVGTSAFWGDDKDKMGPNGGNGKIKKLGLWVPGKPHAVDATRHYLYYMSFTLGDKRYIMQLKD